MACTGRTSRVSERHKASHQLGHRLRGEPEPPAVVRPEAAYRWVDDSPIGDWATVTVVTGLPVDQVLEAFGADPSEDVRFDELLTPDFDPWVAVLPVSGAVLAVEYGGWQGTQEQVLRRASAGGRAASMEWNLTGCRLEPEDVDRIEVEGVGYRILDRADPPSS
jgi:hypothetical protein